ncbi:MAG: hypothetical protein Q4B64_11735, partial [Spirochaetales bacterium]|nr:hypothetical protein [Spirochaetales bacterium]
MNGNKEIIDGKMNYIGFFETVKEQKGICDLWLKILNMLAELQPGMCDECLKLFCIYFSLLDDGNTCVALDKNVLLEKWLGKWNGLILVSGMESKLSPGNFESIISKGIEEILGNKCNVIVENL